MLNSPVQFAGIKDFIVPNEASKKGAPKVKKVYALKPDAITAQEACAQGLKIKLSDDSFAYVHPYDANVQNRIGAHKLAKLLQFDLSPKVKAIEIPPVLSRKNARPTSTYGSIVDWIDGPTYKAFSKHSISLKQFFDPTNLMELYLFFLISQDSDFHHRNIIVKPSQDANGPVKLFAIDNEKAASSAEGFISGLWKYPRELRAQIEDQPIPKEVQEKLRHFVANKSAGAAKLSSFFPAEQVETSYKIAQFLLEQERIPKQTEIAAFLQKEKKAENKNRLFQYSRRILEQFFSKKHPTELLSKQPSSLTTSSQSINTSPSSTTWHHN